MRLLCGSINVRERPWASKRQPIDYQRCCTDRLNAHPKSGQTLVGGGQAKPQGAGRLLRLDVELLRESAPLLLLSADDLRGTLRRTAAVCRQTKRQEPLLDIGAAEVEIDLVIELRDHFRWCACWRDNRKKTIHDDARHGLVQRRQIWQAGKALARSHREAPHLASLHDSISGCD